MTIHNSEWATLYVCLVGSGDDFPEPSSAITASDIALSQAGFAHLRTAVDAHLTAAWEIHDV